MGSKRFGILNKVVLSVFLAGTLLLPQAGVFAEAGTDNFTDVALGKPYTVTQGFRDSDLMSYEINRDGDNGSQGRLTDGKIAAEPSFQDVNWVGYARQVSRSVVIDLQAPMLINSIVGGFLQERPSAVELPRYINFDVSNDGQTWYRAGTENPVISTSQAGSRHEIGRQNINVVARYVRVEFEVGMFSFVDEITVNGRNAAAGDADAAVLPVAQPPQDAAPPTLEETGGVKNMYLAFYYPPDSANAALGTWTEHDFDSVITHTDSSGKPTDWMFDTVLFSNGGSDSDYSTKDNWSQFLDQLFTDGKDIDALDKAAGNAASQLGDPAHKTRFVISIPFANPSATNVWGQLDAENISFNSAAGEDASFDSRKKAVDWYIQEVLKRVGEKQYQHLEFAGFYWHNEEIPFGTIHEEDFVKHTASVIHAAGKKLFWIPFFQANGSTVWKELGFDASMMQPNYYFKSGFAPNTTSGTIDLSRLQSTIGTAKRFGMGVEVEGDYQMAWNGWQTDWDGQLYNGDYAIRKFDAYLNEYQKSGLDQSIVGYYWGAKTVLPMMFNSTNPAVRGSYDDAAQFTNGRYVPKVLDETTIPLPAGDTWDRPIVLDAKEGDIYTSNIAITSAKFLKFPIKAGEDWVVTLTPLNGAALSMESRLWGPTQTQHSGFSYNKPTVPQSLIVSNPTSTDTAVMLRVFPDSKGGQFKISLHKPVEDGTSMMNAIRLPNDGQVEGSATAGQSVWYKINGKKSYTLTLAPKAQADFDLQLYYDANSGQPQAGSAHPGGVTEIINYNNVYADSFVYYVLVTAKTTGGYTLTNGAVTPDTTPPTPPAVSPVKEGDTSITGTAEPWSLVSVTRGGKPLTSAFADPSGQFDAGLLNASSAGLVLNYTFENSAVQDQSPAGNNGIVFGNPKVQYDELFGKNVLVLDGSSHVRIRSNPTLKNKQISLVSQFSLDTLSYTEDVAGNTEGSGFAFAFDAPSKKLVGWAHINGAYQKLFSPVLEANRVYTAAMTYDGNTLLMYLDGKLVDSKTIAGGITTSNIDFAIGADPGPGDIAGYFFHGKIGYLRLFNKALPIEELLSFGEGLKEGDVLSVTAADSAGNVSSPSRATVIGEPPVTTASLTSNVTPMNGWYPGAVSVELNATDTSSGVAATYYTLDNGVQQSGTRVDVTTDGEHNVTYWSVDNVGNVEQPHSLAFKIDQTPPAVMYSEKSGTVYTVDQNISIACSTSDALSGVASSTCKDINGPAYTFGLGTHPYSATAVDYAGNVGTGSTDFTVQVTFESLIRLLQNLVLPEAGDGIENSLEAKLQAAMNSANRNEGEASNQSLIAFQHEVSAQSGKKLSEDHAELLTTLSQALIH